MSKMDIYNTFFHSPNWANPSDDKPLEKLRGILHDGYILSPLKMGKKSPYPEPCRSDCVYLSVHPDGNFGKMFQGKNYYVDYNSGYAMSIQGLSLILSAELMKDYKLESGVYDCECTVLDQIELYKYLIGIGNAGYSIKNGIEISYNYVRYFNGEITISEFARFMRERTIIVGESIDRCLDYVYNSLTSYNHLIKVVDADIDRFIDVGKYYQVLKILEEEGKNIPLYDKDGNSLSPENSREKVRMMLDYIASSSKRMQREINDSFAIETKECLREHVKGIK